MAKKMLQGKDSLPPKDNWRLSDREINWFWYYSKLSTQQPHQFKTTQEKREIIYNIFNDDRSTYELAIKNKEQFLLNESELKWIKEHKKNDRLIIFIINSLINTNNIPAYNFTSTDNYEYLIHLLDNFVLLNKDMKLNQLHFIRSIWSNLQSNNNDTKWIDIKNDKQIDWIWNYLKKTYKLETFQIQPINNHQRYNYILANIDLLTSHMSSEAKELYLLKMKKTWAQKKYRDSEKFKKSYHIPLTIQRHNELENLARLLNKSIPDILDSIIKEAYQKHTTDNEGNLKKY
ncbi:hypothetical protein [Acinetobacter vivianii]|uniref:hypothetical protein n=1 Tax=Acinetobacter vivianii TaxID=1776742 RepID=UPI0019064929|nr:hypothetical protein [Acinetobacter vivianii]MBJ8482405.1 hypothetical protein [Acinetobacter vivianii]